MNRLFFPILFIGVALIISVAYTTGVFGVDKKGDTSMVSTSTDYESLQAEIDQVKAENYRAYALGGPADSPALRRLDASFQAVLEDVRTRQVTQDIALLFVYNMGIIVKTPQVCFSIDLVHRHAADLAPFLDFALITHNHGDHYVDAFYKAMNSAGKTVISNFKDNYGTANWSTQGGYTRVPKTFEIGDVRIATSLTDHNAYLVDFTTVFDIEANGVRLLHSGDCSNIDKLNPSAAPDFWFVHPRCGMDPVDGVRKFAPKTTVVAHLNELGHDKWRWSWQDGLDAKARIEAEGGSAIVPVWGERLCP